MLHDGFKESWHLGSGCGEAVCRDWCDTSRPEEVAVGLPGMARGPSLGPCMCGMLLCGLSQEACGQEAVVLV